MRRKINTPWMQGGALLLALVLSILPGPARGQRDNGPRPNSLVVTINGTIRLQTSTRKPIKTVVNPKESVVAVRTIPGDPTTVLIVGEQPDVTHLELTDADGKTETFEVIVQADIEYLRTQMRRAVPTANITPIPTSNNTVILAGTVSRAEDVAIIRGLVQSVGFQYIDAMRVGGVQQVQLDVIVAQVSRAELRSMAHNFLADTTYGFFGNTTGAAVANPASVGTGAPFTNASRITSTLGSPNGNPTNLLFGVVHNSWGLQHFLAFLRNENLAKLIAEPRLVTSSGRPASFLAGGEQAIPVPAGLGQVGVQFEEFGTRLNFIPIVLGNGKIRMEVEPEVSYLSSQGAVQIQGATVQGRVTNRINTTVELEAGQTFVIGGLIQHQVAASTSKVPFLGDLPICGWCFRSVSYQDQEEELLVLVTPWLVDPLSCDQRPKILPGMETRKPDDFELFLEGIIEAPRGQRQAYQNGKYVPPYKSSPSAAIFPTVGGAPWAGPGGLSPMNGDTLPGPAQPGATLPGPGATGGPVEGHGFGPLSGTPRPPSATWAGSAPMQAPGAPSGPASSTSPSNPGPAPVGPSGPGTSPSPNIPGAAPGGAPGEGHPAPLVPEPTAEIVPLPTDLAATAGPSKETGPSSSSGSLSSSMPAAHPFKLGLPPR